MLPDGVVVIVGDADVVAARSRAKEVAGELGFSRTDLTLIAAAVSEIARNIVVYAGTGQITLRAKRGEGRWGLAVVASDEGPASPTWSRLSPTGTPPPAVSVLACLGLAG